MSYILNIRVYSSETIQPVSSVHSWIVHKLQRFLLGPNFSGTCKCEKRLEVTRSSQSSRPRYVEHNREGVAPEGRVARKKKLAEQTVDKKAALQRRVRGVTLQCGRKSMHSQKHFFCPACPPPVALLCLFLVNSRLQVARVFHCTRYFRCNRIQPSALTFIKYSRRHPSVNPLPLNIFYS